MSGAKSFRSHLLKIANGSPCNGRCPNNSSDGSGYLYARKVSNESEVRILFEQIVECRLRFACGVTRIVTGRAVRGVLLTLITSLLVFDPLRRRFATFVVGPWIEERAVLAGVKV
jgi:hypothetical protein